jgi:hypothetical protein
MGEDAVPLTPTSVKGTNTWPVGLTRHDGTRRGSPPVLLTILYRLHFERRVPTRDSCSRMRQHE